MNGQQAHNAIAKAIGIHPDAMHARDRKTATRAAKLLKQHGYRHEYCHGAWQRGMRWYAPAKDYPETDTRALDLLMVEVVHGRVTL